MKKIILFPFCLLLLYPSVTYAANPGINYQIIEPNAGVGGYANGSFYFQGNTSWNTSLPKLVTDGTYIYSLVAMGDEATGVKGEMGLEIRRKRVNTDEDFITIWSKPSGVFRVVGALALDKQKRLHVFYTAKVGASGYLKHEIALLPQTNPVSFSLDSAQPLTGECRNCRLGVAYDNSTDSLYVVFDKVVNSYPVWASSYLAVYRNGSWSIPEKIVDWPFLDTNTVFAYAYPKIIVFNNKLHVFFVGHPYSSTLKWFKSIIHYYRELGSGTWSHEMIKDSPIPFAAAISDPSRATDQAFIYDAFVTGDGQLAIMGMYKTCPSGNCSIQTLEFVSPSGVGGWQPLVIYSGYNASPCVEKTSDNLYHMFKPKPFDKIEYAQSADGKTWVDFPITNVPNISLIGQVCMEENGVYLDKAYVVLDGFSPTQNTANHNMSKGHTVVLGELSLSTSFPPPSVYLPIPGDISQDGHVNILDLRQLAANFTNIFAYAQLVGNYGQ
jgi:hypothetical protein